MKTFLILVGNLLFGRVDVVCLEIPESSHHLLTAVAKHIVDADGRFSLRTPVSIFDTLPVEVPGIGAPKLASGRSNEPFTTKSGVLLNLPRVSAAKTGRHHLTRPANILREIGIDKIFIFTVLNRVNITQLFNYRTITAN